MIKSGLDHIASLRDGRAVYLHGKRVDDVTRHPAYANAVKSIGRLFDFPSAASGADDVSSPIRASAPIASGSFPRATRSCASAAKRSRPGTACTAASWGARPITWLRASPACTWGWRSSRPTTARGPGRSPTITATPAINDLYLTYVIINPQADRSKSASRQQDAFLTAGVVDRDAAGITVRGAKMLATGGIMANEVLVTCIQPLQPGDEKYAVSFAIPMNAKGLKILSRKSYEEEARSVFDNPLSSRFDENDAVLFFDDVKVPWDRVFVIDSLEMCQRQFHATPAHVYQNYQAMVRLSVKFRFLLGIAHRIAEVNGTTGFPQVRETLGRLAAEAGMVDAFVAAMEAKGTRHGRYFVPDRHTLYAALTLTQKLYATVLNTLRELAGGGMIMLPSSLDDFRNPEIAALIEKTQQSPAASATERVKFYKLAWDAVGSEFASRHAQYEMFYSGASFVTAGAFLSHLRLAGCRPGARRHAGKLRSGG